METSIKKLKEEQELKLNTDSTLYKELRKIVSEEDLYYTKFEIRARLILTQTPNDEFINTIFEGYSDSELISIKELYKNLSKRPLELPMNQSESLARFLIEVRKNPIIKYFPYQDKAVKEIKNNIKEFLGISYNFIPTELNDIINKTLLKVRWRKEQFISKMATNFVNLKKWREVFQDVAPELEHIEKDIFIAIGFERTKDMKQLSIKV